MTLGETYISHFLAYAGRVVEETGNNDGPQIEAWQREAERVYGKSPGYYAGAPYCGIAAGCIAREAGIPESFIAEPYRLWHPYTGFITDQADRMGGLAPTGPLAPTGSLIVKAGVHVGAVVHDRGNGVLDTVEANAGNAVRRMVRAKADWRIVVPPGIVGAPPPQYLDSFGFDDLTVKPSLLGGWTTSNLRDIKMAGWEASKPGWWTRPVRDLSRDSQFAFWTGPPGTWEDDWGWWEYGGWTAGGDAAKAYEVREDQIARFERHNGHANVRRWRRRVPVPEAGIPDRSGAGALVAADGISTR